MFWRELRSWGYLKSLYKRELRSYLQVSNHILVIGHTLRSRSPAVEPIVQSSQSSSKALLQAWSLKLTANAPENGVPQKGINIFPHKMAYLSRWFSQLPVWWNLLISRRVSQKENSTINFQVRTVNFRECIFFCFRGRSQHMQEDKSVIFFVGHTLFRWV